MNKPLFETKQKSKKSNYGKFVISPLEQGYGNTLGNSLRRVLLTSIPGSAITSVRIAGVKHQFSTLKGVKEDVVEFLLNLKKVRLSRTEDDGKPVKASLSAIKAGEVKAGDIEVGPTVTVANPDLVLAVLNKDTKLEAKMEVETGVGYSPSDDRVTGEIGLIVLDASFSPIVRVNYKVEETRVGRLTNFDKLVLEIWTDGTIEASDALKKAASTLGSYYKQIVSPQKAVKKESKKEEGLGPVGNLSVEEINLPTRVANALVRAGYETVDKLVYAKKSDLVKVRNLGEKSVKIIEAALGEKDLKFAEDK